MHYAVIIITQGLCLCHLPTVSTSAAMLQLSLPLGTRIDAIHARCVADMLAAHLLFGSSVCKFSSDDRHRFVYVFLSTSLLLPPVVSSQWFWAFPSSEPQIVEDMQSAPPALQHLTQCFSSMCMCSFQFEIGSPFHKWPVNMRAKLLHGIAIYAQWTADMLAAHLLFRSSMYKF